MRRKLISSDEGKPAVRQLTKPCSDCPWVRDALPGWLGPASAEEWIACAHSDQRVKCHVHTNVQCAGLGIYRKNVCKSPRDPQDVAHTLTADRDHVFARPDEFLEHHSE